MTRGRLRVLATVVALTAALGAAGCQPSLTSQLEASLPRTSARPATTPNEVGREADSAATALLNSQVAVRVSVPPRSIAASRTAKGGHILAVVTAPVLADLTQSDRRFVGFTVISQEPTAGTSLPATQSVVLVVGPHPKALPGAAWYSTHKADVKRAGDAGCFNATSGGETGCHSQSFCVDCHSKALKP